MMVNLSEETITTVYNSLRSSKHDLNRQLDTSISNGKISPNKVEIIKHQLAEVEDALQVFEELMEIIGG